MRLPQPGSFEGLQAVVVVVDPGDLAVADEDDLGPLHLHTQSTHMAPSALPRERDDSPIWGEAKVVDADFVGIPNAELLVDELTNPLMAAIDRLRPFPVVGEVVDDF